MSERSVGIIGIGLFYLNFKFPFKLILFLFLRTDTTMQQVDANSPNNSVSLCKILIFILYKIAICAHLIFIFHCNIILIILLFDIQFTTVYEWNLFYKIKI